MKPPENKSYNPFEKPETGIEDVKVIETTEDILRRETRHQYLSALAGVVLAFSAYQFLGYKRAKDDLDAERARVIAAYQKMCRDRDALDTILRFGECLAVKIHKDSKDE